MGLDHGRLEFRKGPDVIASLGQAKGITAATREQGNRSFVGTERGWCWDGCCWSWCYDLIRCCCNNGRLTRRLPPQVLCEPRFPVKWLQTDVTNEGRGHYTILGENSLPINFW